MIISIILAAGIYAFGFTLLRCMDPRPIGYRGQRRRVPRHRLVTA